MLIDLFVRCVYIITHQRRRRECFGDVDINSIAANSRINMNKCDMAQQWTRNGECKSTRAIIVVIGLNLTCGNNLFIGPMVTKRCIWDMQRVGIGN